MKKFLFAVLLAAVTLVSCEKEIKFNGHETAQRVVLYSQAIAGEPLTAAVSASLFFLDRDSKKYISVLDTITGSVKVYVNGSTTPIVMTYEPEELDYPWQVRSKLQYVSDYIPACGDHIRIVADFPGFETVEGETTVPKKPDLEILNVKMAIDEEGVSKYDVTVRIKDDGSYSKYYSLIPEAQFEDYFCALDVKSSDIVFQDTANELMSLIGGDDSVVPYFSDVLFHGDHHDINFKFDYNAFWFMSPNEAEECDMVLAVSTLTESLYYHMLSLRQMDNDLGFFSEGTTLYSNVKGGYGCVCSSVSLYLQLK